MELTVQGDASSSVEESVQKLNQNEAKEGHFDSDYWRRVLQTANIFFMFMAAVSQSLF